MCRCELEENQLVVNCSAAGYDRVPAQPDEIKTKVIVVIVFLLFTKRINGNF